MTVTRKTQVVPAMPNVQVPKAGQSFPVRKASGGCQPSEFKISCDSK